MPDEKTPEQIKKELEAEKKKGKDAGNEAGAAAGTAGAGQAAPPTPEEIREFQLRRLTEIGMVAVANVPETHDYRSFITGYVLERAGCMDRQGNPFNGVATAINADEVWTEINRLERQNDKREAAKNAEQTES